MKRIFLLCFGTLISCMLNMNCSKTGTTGESAVSSGEKQRLSYVIAIHGGAGAIRKTDMTPEMEAEYRKALNEALDIGETILKNGGPALEAVEKTIVYLEDCPLFNAGKGAVFTNAGTHELDASVMDGSTQQAGAIGGVTIIKNPIKAAIAVMHKSPHVLLTGKGAEQFCIAQGLDTVPNSWFDTDSRRKALEKIKAKEESKTGMLSSPGDYKFGTVGCVALDNKGNLAAGTSTGGMTNKRWGRLGDSPIIGAGTYADNATCAVSCTGHGEYFIRYTVAYDVAARMKYLGENLKTAAEFVIHKKLLEKGGEGGLIALDAAGNVSMPFNSEGMYRAVASPNRREVGIYKD